MTTHLFSRRDLLKLSAGAAAFTCAGLAPQLLSAAAKTAASRKIPVGLQLYSVRNECEKDLVGTVTEVSKMGYRGVEFAGYYGRDAKTLRKLLDDVGLKCCGTHIGIDTLLGEQFAKTVEFNQTLGNKFLIVPGLPDQYPVFAPGLAEYG